VGVHKVRIGFVFRPADPDKHGTGQLGQIPPHDDSCGRFRSPIEFDISGTGEHYIDFGNTMLYVKAKVTALDDMNMPADAAFGPVNLFLHSLFSQVDISLNGTLITASTNTYPYRAMMETLLRYGEDAKSSQLTSALYYKDQPGRMDSVDFVDNARNSGLAKRRAIARQSPVFDMMGRIHADIFFQERYMLNEVGIKIKLVRSKDAFCLMSALACKAQIGLVHASLFVRKVKLMPSVFLAHAKTLERGTRGMQVVYSSSELLGRESRETVFRTTSHAHSHRTGEQPGVQRAPDEQPVQFPAFRSERDSVVLGWTTAACRETYSTELRDGAVYKSIL